jgi:hypothetical protein
MKDRESPRALKVSTKRLCRNTVRITLIYTAFRDKTPVSAASGQQFNHSRLWNLYSRLRNFYSRLWNPLPPRKPVSWR